MCLYPTASLIEEKPDSRTRPFRPLTMDETIVGPLNTRAEYNWSRDAPDMIASQAESFESMPPTPTMGIFPFVSSYAVLITSSALDCSGRPERPPSLENALRDCVVRGIGLFIVVFVATMPSIPDGFDEGRTIAVRGDLVTQNGIWLIDSFEIQTGCPSKYES